MQPFTLNFAENKAVSGFVSIPPSPATSKHGPLLVLLHGGSYAADYYDADEERSIEPFSKALGIPVIALNRQGYKDSTALSLSEGETSFGEQAKALHESILPQIWEKYGKESGVSSLVLAGHSVGAMVAMTAASLHAQSSSRTYPLSGLCITGIADAWHPQFTTAPPPAPPIDETGKFVLWPDMVRDAMMLMIPDGRADPTFSARHAELNNPVPIAEVMESMAKEGGWREAAAEVKAPVLHLVGEYDGLWDTGKEAMAGFVKLFKKTTVESGVVGEAPHCLEISYQGKAVFLKVLGHAVQCAVEYGYREEKTR